MSVKKSSKENDLQMQVMRLKKKIKSLESDLGTTKVKLLKNESEMNDLKLKEYKKGFKNGKRSNNGIIHNLQTKYNELKVECDQWKTKELLLKVKMVALKELNGTIDLCCTQLDDEIYNLNGIIKRKCVALFVHFLTFHFNPFQ